MRQKRDKWDSLDADPGLDDRVTFWLKATYAFLVGALLARTTAVVCLTEGIRQTTEREYGIDLSDAAVIGMGVDCDVFLADGLGARPDRFDEPLVITYVGSFGHTRGFPHVIDALAKTEYDVEFHVVGEGTPRYLREMKARADRRGVADRVEWHGRVPHEEVPAVLAEADLAISPLADIESYRISFPAKLLEYMAAGVVTVATDIPAHRTVIDHGENGLLYDGTPAGLCEVIRQCLENPTSKRSIERVARETAERYDWDVVVERHERVLFADAPERDVAAVSSPPVT